MKYIMKFFVLLGVFAIVTSCNKDAVELVDRPKIDVVDPTAQVPLDFNVKLDEASVLKVGSPIKFIIEGNADMVNFYSGSVGNDYNYRETDRFYDVVPKLSFETNQTPDNNSIANLNNLELYYSTNFNGVYTYDNIKNNTTWVPIKSRFAFQTQLQATANTYLESGSVSVADAFAEGKPVYFAWLCKTNAGTNRVQFRIRSFTLVGEVADNNTLSGQLYSQGQFDFKWYENPESAAQTTNRPTVTSTLLTWSGIFGNLTGPYKEGYAVASVAATLPKFNAGKDKPTVIVTKRSKLEYNYTYKKAGTYEVTFVASQLTSGAQGEVVKKINVTIQN